MVRILFGLMLLLIQHVALAKTAIETREVSYKSGDKTMVGYLVMPKNLTKATAAVLVIHEWWGQTEYPRSRAEELGEMGYIALAVDMYGGKKTLDHPKDAGSFAQEVMASAAAVRMPFDAALLELKKVPYVDESKIAAIGFCFGGSVVLEMARQNVPGLKGVASFHGGLLTPSKAEDGKISARILVLNGAEDKMVTAKDIEIFKAEMAKAKADANVEFVNLPDAMHGFSNPKATELGKKYHIPIAYNEKAATQGWKKLASFLERLFQTTTATVKEEKKG